MLAAEEAGQFVYKPPDTGDEGKNVQDDKLDNEEGPQTPPSTPVHVTKVRFIKLPNYSLALWSIICQEL